MKTFFSNMPVVSTLLLSVALLSTSAATASVEPIVLSPRQMPDSPFQSTMARAVATGAETTIAPSLVIPQAHQGKYALVYTLAITDDGVTSARGENGWSLFHSDSLLPMRFVRLEQTLSVDIYSGALSDPSGILLLYGYILAEGDEAGLALYGNGMHVTVSETARKLQDLLDSLIDNPPELINMYTGAFETPEIPGVVLGLEIPGEGYWYGASGVADMESGRLVKPTDKFHSGSITKTFTAMLVLQLVDEGLLGLDDSVEEWLPGLVPNGASIRVEDLLRHTTGLNDYAWHDDWWLSLMLEEDTRTYTPEEMIGLALQMGTLFEPGSLNENGNLNWMYSSTNYSLLGLIAEAAAGDTLDAQFESRFFGPLQLDATGTVPLDPGMEEAMTGYTNWIMSGFFKGVDEDGSYIGGFDPSIGLYGGVYPNSYSLGAIDTCNGAPCVDELLPMIHMDASFAFGSGNMVSNVPDMVTWIEAVVEGRLLRYATQDRTLTFIPIEVEGVGEGQEMGLGVARLEGSWIGHQGQIPGFDATVIYEMDCAVPIAAAFNRSLWYVSPQGAPQSAQELLIPPALQILQEDGHCSTNP